MINSRQLAQRMEGFFFQKRSLVGALLRMLLNEKVPLSTIAMTLLH